MLAVLAVVAVLMAAVAHVVTGVLVVGVRVGVRVAILRGAAVLKEDEHALQPLQLVLRLRSS